MEGLTKILEYKERINQNVKEIIELINEPQQQSIKPKDEFYDLMCKDLHVDRIAKNEVAIKQKITDIINCVSCMAILWREDRVGQVGNFIDSLKSLFELCFRENQQPQIRKEVLEMALGYVNFLVLPIHENKKWETLIEINPILAKIKIAIRSMRDR